MSLRPKFPALVCLGLLASACHTTVNVNPVVRTPVRANTAPTLAAIDGNVSGPAASLLGNNAASILGDNGAGLISDQAGGLISLAKFQVLAIATETVAGASVQVEDLQGHVLSSSATTDEQGHFHLTGNFGTHPILAIRARYNRQTVPVSLLAALPTPADGQNATTTVDPGSTLVAKKLAAMVRFGAVDPATLQPAAVAQIAQQVAPVLSASTAVAAAVLPDERTARLFDAVLVQIGKQDNARRAAIDAAAGTALLATTPAGDLPSPAPTATPSPDLSPDVSPSPVASSVPGPSAAASPSPAASTAPAPSPSPSALAPSPSPSPTPDVLVGAFTSTAPGGPSTDLNTFATWLGRPLDLGEDHSWNDSWDDLEGPSAQLPPWGTWKQAGTGRRLLFQLGMFPGPADNSGPTWGKDLGPVSLAQGAAGAYDAHWTQLARNLVAAGLGDTIIDAGYQCNLDYLGWNGRANPAAYIGYFQHIVTAMRAVPGAHFQFAWGVTLGGGWDVETAYPGDGYVDYITIDFGDDDTNQYPATGTVSSSLQDTVWQSKVDGYKGLKFWSDFSATHANKPLGFTAWSLDTVANHAGGDDPGFVQHFHDWITDPTHHFAFQIYWDEADGSHDHRLSAADSPFPLAAAKFKALFGK